MEQALHFLAHQLYNRVLLQAHANFYINSCISENAHNDGYVVSVATLALPRTMRKLMENSARSLRACANWCNY